jgi:NADPH-dependent 2,4-dienoyl-CoA reductase/sulfur reductase-like enzyme
VAVVGGGFIGAEVASAARQAGCPVVMIEATELPMQRVLGAEAAALLAGVLAEAGVDYRGGAVVSGVVADGDAIRIELAGPSTGDVRADTVVVGIGSVPQSGWLGIEGPGGIACDARGRAAGIPNAYAIGDVAAWPDPHRGARSRTEHWTSARTQAAVVAADLAGSDRFPPAEPDYFWTDQFGLKIQVIGRPDLADHTVLLRPDDGGVRRSVALYLRGGSLVGCALFSAARQLARCTALVRDGVDEATALAALAG